MEETGTVRNIHPVEHFTIQPYSVRGFISEFFMDETRVKQFLEFNSLKHEKGIENIGPGLAAVLYPHIERLMGSPDSQQRAAAEMMYGLVSSSGQLWCWLLPVFQQSDWDFCFSGASNEADPNRLRVLYELLITPKNLVSQGTFKESSYQVSQTRVLFLTSRGGTSGLSRRGWKRASG
jgi:hypothetical protein